MLTAYTWVQGADQAFAFASGMAALAAVLRLVGAGKGVVAGDDLYGGTSRLLAQVAPNLGIQVTNVDTTDIRCKTLTTKYFLLSICHCVWLRSAGCVCFHVESCGIMFALVMALT